MIIFLLEFLFCHSNYSFISLQEVRRLTQIYRANTFIQFHIRKVDRLFKKTCKADEIVFNYNKYSSDLCTLDEFFYDNKPTAL